MGVDASVVEGEVDVALGLPTFTMFGLPDSSVRESRDRVRSAIRNSEFEFPARRITINLVPPTFASGARRTIWRSPLVSWLRVVSSPVATTPTSCFSGNYRSTGRFSRHAGYCRWPSSRSGAR